LLSLFLLCASLAVGLIRMDGAARPHRRKPEACLPVLRLKVPPQEHPMPEIARLKITLDHVEPAVMRRIEVPTDISLDDLHLVIQRAMPWENCHLYEFSVGRSLAWGIPDPDSRFEEHRRDAAKATLADLLDQGGRKAFKYTYDFGDDWEHSIKVEAIAEAAAGFAYPRLLAAKGACPPEDIGGPWGYGHYLDAIADPKHENHAQMIEWGDPDFDPAVADEPLIQESFAALANYLARKGGSVGRPRVKRRA
jgi:Plasmid pRiA4b ORF-3-like protein